MSPDARLNPLVLNQIQDAAPAQKAAELEIGRVWALLPASVQMHGMDVLHPHSTQEEVKGAMACEICCLLCSTCSISSGLLHLHDGTGRAGMRPWHVSPQS